MHWAFRLAKKMARNSSGRQKIGAVLVQKRFIAGGCAQPGKKTHPLLERWKGIRPYQSLHAEMHVCLSVDDDATEGANLYVYRERRDGSQGMARPCPICWEYLQERGVRKVFYTLDDEGFAEAKISSGISI